MRVPWSGPRAAVERRSRAPGARRVRLNAEVSATFTIRFATLRKRSGACAQQRVEPRAAGAGPLRAHSIVCVWRG
jgi:hypothetical protein